MSEEKVGFENARGLALSGVLHLPGAWEPGGPSAVVCHGMLSAKDSPKHTGFCTRLADRGVMALRFDFAGRGESDGRTEDLTVSGQVRDLAAAVNLVRGRGAGSVSLVGSSLGGAVAVLYAGQFGGVASLAGLASVSRPGAIFRERLSEEEMRAWKRTGALPVEGETVGYGFYEDALNLDVLAAARRIRCPALFIHGSEDDVVPTRSSRDLHEMVPGRKKLIIVDGADHRFSNPAHLGQVVGLLVGWIAL
jgi:pimeloyl-ACP methyl ester carboxylesterase